MSKSGVQRNLQVLFICLLLPTGVAGHAINSNELIPPNKTENVQPEQEVFLSFNYRNLFNKVIIAYFEDGNYYLPVSEVFSSLKIPNTVNTTDFSLVGSYLDPANTYRFDFKNYTVSLDGKGSFSFSADEMLVKELDYYVQLNVLSEVFDLNFTVDLNNLLLQLQTPHVLPIVEEQQRAERRRRQEKFSVGQNFYPLEYDRDRKMLGGGFFDYSLSAILSENVNNYNYDLDLGTEVLGGDLQGSAFGSYSDNFSSFTTNNLRWRYVMRNNNKLTQVFAGQTNSDGLINRNFTGIRLTNDPIEPRFLYDSFEIEGRVEPGSEVELYYNNALYDFQRVTDTEQYRFLAPLTYGTSRLRLRIYGPDGRITEREERIQIPFSFLPQGEFSYHINAGKLDNSIFGSTRESNIVQGDFAYGISNQLTQKVGIEYFNEFSEQSPLLYSSTSARLFGDYLFNVDLAPTAFYRVSGNIVYPSSASLGVNYTYFSDTGIYNPLGNDQELSGNIFYPFSIGEIPLNIRVIGNYAARQTVDNTGYTVDLNSRINRFNVRLSYRDRKFGRISLDPSPGSSVSASATYLISRKPDIPRYLQNTFISGRLDYNPGLAELEQAEIQASRSIFDKGRIQASFSRNFIGDFNFVNVGVTIDFNSVRTTSTFRNSRNRPSFTQNVRGSIGFDEYNKDVVLSNRQQVGRSATSLRLYVDSNNSGNFEKGEEVIDNEAVRIGRAGVSSSSKNGILRFSQLRPYHRVNLEINESAIENPLLVPKEGKFSIVTDPNRYKPINIPFYLSGVIQGRVSRIGSNSKQAASGIRLFLKSKDRNFEKDIQTFSDGSFYAYEVPPGNYSLRVDSTQLQFLNARSEPEVLEFEVKSLAEGDFIEGLNLEILPLESSEKTVIEKKDTSKAIEPDKTEPELFYEIQLASYATTGYSVPASLRAENLFSESFYVRYNPYADLFALRTAPMTDKEAALDKLLAISDSPFNEPALVISSDTSLSSKDLYPGYAVIFGVLETRSKAEEYAENVGKITGYDSKIYYDASQNTFPVRSKTFPNREDALSIVNELYRRSISSASEFSIVRVGEDKIPELQFGYAIEVIGLEENTAREFYNLIEIREILPDPSKFILSGSILLIEGIPSWKQTVELKRKLDNLLQKGTPILVLNQKQF